MAGPWRERILRHTQCVRGLRIRVSDILDFVAAGASYEEVLADIRSWNGKTFSRLSGMPPGKPIKLSLR